MKSDPMLCIKAWKDGFHNVLHPPLRTQARACRALEGRRPNLKAKSCALAAGATNKDRCNRNRTFSFASAGQWVTETEEADAVDEGVASEVAEEV